MLSPALTFPEPGVPTTFEARLASAVRRALYDGVYTDAEGFTVKPLPEPVALPPPAHGKHVRRVFAAVKFTSQAVAEQWLWAYRKAGRDAFRYLYGAHVVFFPNRGCLPDGCQVGFYSYMPRAALSARKLPSLASLVQCSQPVAVSVLVLDIDNTVLEQVPSTLSGTNGGSAPHAIESDALHALLRLAKHVLFATSRHESSWQITQLQLAAVGIYVAREHVLFTNGKCEKSKAVLDELLARSISFFGATMFVDDNPISAAEMAFVLGGDGCRTLWYCPPSTITVRSTCSHPPFFAPALPATAPDAHATPIIVDVLTQPARTDAVYA